jgi:transcriptional regulator GlxA family with amidase domain
VVPLDELWGSPAVERFLDRLAGVSDTVDAVGILEAVIGERLACATEREFELPLAREAAQRLESASVAAVAADLGVSERHLRRVFRATVGMSPKQFARLARFRRAVGTARENSRLTWADVAATAGYYDQPHLIADFHAIAGASPRALLGELGSD